MDALKDWFLLLCQVGVMIWWMSRINTKMETFQTNHETLQRTLNDHIKDDEKMSAQIQAMAVNEANVGGMLSNLALELRYIRQFLDERTEDTGTMIELKLDRQSTELILKFRDMLHQSRREFAEEAAQAAAHQIREALRTNNK